MSDLRDDGKLLRELSECVLDSWPAPLHARSARHERAVAIAREVLSGPAPAGQRPDEAGEAGGRLGARASAARFAGVAPLGRPAVEALERELTRHDGELAELRDELLGLAQRVTAIGRVLDARTEHLV